MARSRSRTRSRSPVHRRSRHHENSKRYSSDVKHGHHRRRHSRSVSGDRNSRNSHSPENHHSNSYSSSKQRNEIRSEGRIDRKSHHSRNKDHREHDDTKISSHNGVKNYENLSRFPGEAPENKRFPNGNRLAHRNVNQTDEFMMRRLETRERVGMLGVPELWASSPERQPDSDTEVPRDVYKKLPKVDSSSSGHKSSKKKKKKKKLKKEKKEKKKKRKEKKKQQKLKKAKKTEKNISSDSSSSGSESGEEETMEWVEKRITDDSQDDDSEEEITGPLPKQQVQLSSKEYGKALLPGEGAAMAAYIAEGKRIPRRGEIGLTSNEIEDFEKVGYVMSGSRHRRMEAVRLRKENQLYSADEKRALAMFNKDERELQSEKMKWLSKQLMRFEPQDISQRRKHVSQSYFEVYNWTERITNEKVLQLMRTEEILLKRLKERKMRFAGHVMRGSSGDLLNLILEGSIEGVRDRGRQRRTWGDDVKEWSQTTSIGDAKRTAESRENWRRIVANLRNEEGTA
ncbi:NKAP family protein [Nymphon striatum]|nr:NKAP family protein [Nymphon striatum]